jgi:uncharacterized membrane protein (UPF0127 family)
MKYYQSTEFSLYIPETLLEKTQGLLFREHLLNNGCLLLTHCNCVHSFFMKNPIKLYFLSSSFEILKVVDNFPINSLSPFVFSASYTLETVLGFDLTKVNNRSAIFQEVLST